MWIRTDVGSLYNTSNLVGIEVVEARQWRRVWIVRGRVRSGAAPEYVELCAFKVWERAMAVLNGIAEQLATEGQFLDLSNPKAIIPPTPINKGMPSRQCGVVSEAAEEPPLVVTAE
jgi:hypothetical protein